MKLLYKTALFLIILLWVIYFPIAIVVMLLDLILRIVWVKLPYKVTDIPNEILFLRIKVINWYIRRDWMKNRDAVSFNGKELEFDGKNF